MTQAIILMGVSGSGKTTIGKRLSRRTGLPFFEGDNYHPRANVEKMSSGRPLDDADRRPWLVALHQLIQTNLERKRSLILASSALKEKYRDTLRGDLGEQVVFVYLKGDFDLIYRRMKDRKDHFMGKEMLRSQFQALEEPEDGLTVSVDQPIPAIVGEIIQRLALTQA